MRLLTNLSFFSDGDTEFVKLVPNLLTLAMKEDFTDVEGV
jgi:hypothetical protein